MKSGISSVFEGLVGKMAENLDEAFWVRTDKKMIYINPAFEKIWGLPCSAIYKNPQIFTDSIHPDDKEKVDSIFKSSTFINTGLFEYEYRIMRPDHQVRWISAKSVPVLNDKGEIMHRIGIARDITSQKIMQQETSLLASMLDVAPNSITVHDEAGKFLYANQKTFEIHGYQPDEFMKLRLNQLDVFESAAQIESRIQTIRENGYATFEVEHIKKDGSTFPLEVFVKLVDWKGIPAMLSIATDISARKKAENEIIESEAKFRAFVENANDIIYQLNAQGIFTYISPNVKELLGYNQEEFIGQKVEQFVHPDELNLCREFLYKVLSTGKKQSGIEYRIKHKNGSWRWHSSNGSPLNDEQSKTTSYFGISRDITERKYAEEQVIEHNREYEALNEELRQTNEELFLAKQIAEASETKFKAAFYTSPDSVNINKLNGEYVEINEGFTRLTGFTKEDAIGRLSAEIDIWAIPEDREKLVKGLKEDGIVENLESLFRAKDGRLIPALMSARLINLHGEPHILSVTRDISSRKHYEQELIKAKEIAEETQENLQFLYENMIQGVIYHNLKGQVIHANQAAAKILGLTLDQLYGKTPIDPHWRSIHEDGSEYPGELHPVMITLKTGQPVQNAIMGLFIPEQNGYSWININSIPKFNASSELVQVVVTFEDITEIRNAKAKAEENERKLMESQAMAKLGSWELNIASGIFTFTDNFYKIFHTNAIEMGGYQMSVNDYVTRFVHPDDAPLAAIEIQKAIETNDPLFSNYVEHRILYADGGEGNIAVKFSVQKDKNGKTIRTFGVNQDITERKKAELELAKNETLIRTVIENHPIIFYIIDQNGIFNLSVGAGLKSLGLMPNQVVGMSVYEVYKDYPAIMDAVRKALMGEIITFESDVNNVFHLNVIRPINSNNMKDGIVGVALDITDRKKIENELLKAKEKAEESETRYKALHNASFGGITIHDKGLILDCNKGLSEITGYSYNELIGMDGLMLIAERYRDFVMEKIVSGFEEPYEAVGLRKNGEEYPLRLDARNIPYKGKQVRSVEFRDITKQKSIENELRTAKEKAEESDRLKSAFLQNMSHEIRTPMNAIMGFSQLMQKNLNNPKKLEHFSEIINQRCDDLLNLIDDLLDIAKIESGGISLSPEQCNLRAIFNDIYFFFKEYQKRIGKEHIELKSNIGSIPQSLNIYIDQPKLKQIFINLINNSFKFTEQGYIEFGCSVISNNEVNFYVRDTGIGIPADKHHFIFERFAQVYHGPEKVFGGTGLGLSIVKGLVEAMEGKIWVESEPGKGAAFNFSIKCLPRLMNAQIPAEKAIEPEVSHFPDLTLLIVEDDIYNMNYLCELFDGKGPEIIKAFKGEDAIRMALEHKPGMILLDIGLPDISGYEVARTIIEKWPEALIIAQTAYASNEDKTRAIESGCCDFVSKPIKSEILFETMNKWLNK